MEIYTGNYRILESGSILTFNTEDSLNFVIEPNPNFKFQITVEMVENGGERDFKREVDKEKNIISLQLINFGQGAGTANPIEIGVSNGKKIYMHLWSSIISASQTVRKIEYTFYIER